MRTTIAVVVSLAALAAPTQAAGMPLKEPAADGHCRTHACWSRVHNARVDRYVRRKIRTVTPYRCGFGRSAIPCYVVMCESGGSWSAYNPSGAAGLYQIMASWGRPFPVRSARDRLVHHRIAYRLWQGGRGSGNWVCA